MSDKLHPIIGHAGAEMADGKIARREFLRIATLLGVTAPVAYGMAGLSLPVMAQTAAPKKGGIIRLGMRVQDLKSPHTYSWIQE
jgi:peptide/nickel transport system substrate-binding protein